jgi:hypothetical protein
MKKHLYILVSLVLLSCGSRKVQVNTTEIKKDSIVTTTQIDSSKSIKTTDDNTNIDFNTEETEICIIPLDSTKEIHVNGKTYFNVKLRIKKRKDNTTYQNTKKVAQIDLKHVIKHTEAKSSTKENTKVKNIDRKESILNYWWILLLIILIYLFYKWQNKLRLL